jgi:hypothetical protein
MFSFQDKGAACFIPFENFPPNSSVFPLTEAVNVADSIL